MQVEDMEKVCTKKSLLSLLVMGALAVTSGTLWAAAPPPTPEVEPNNSAATANVINLSGGFVQLSGSIGSSGDYDYYKISGVPAGGRIWFNMDTGGAQQPGATSRDTVIDLVAADGTTVIENDDDDGTGNGGDGTVETGLSSAIAGRILTAGGDYYIRVRAFSASAVINPYVFAVAITDPTTTPGAPEVEANDTAATANPIVTVTQPINVRTGSIGQAADSDYYSVYAEAGDAIYFMADGDPERDGAGTDLILELRGPGDNVLLTVDSSTSGSLSNPVAEGARYLISTAGTYYIRVRHFSAVGTGTYHLMAARAVLILGAPTAQPVSITGGASAAVGAQLTGAYTYADQEGDLEGASLYRWMSDSQASGASRTAIGGAVATSYTPVLGDAGRYLFFCVTPVAVSGGALTGSETCSSASAAVAADDGDGIPTGSESDVPSLSGSGTGDGNGDNIPDSQQPNVASLQTAAGGAYVTIVSTSNRPLLSVSAVASPLPGSAYAPFGAFSFTATNVAPSATETFELYVPYNPSINAALKQNRFTLAWENVATSITHIGTVKTRITFSLANGGPYDADGQAGNSQIQDPIVPAGLNGPMAVPTLSEWGVAILTMLMAAAALFTPLRRRL